MLNLGRHAHLCTIPNLRRYAHLLMPFTLQSLPRPQHHHRDHHPTQITPLNYLKTRLVHRSFRITIPVAIAREEPVNGVSISCKAAATRPWARTCSTISSVPPGLRTRRISCRPRRGSVTEQKTRVQTALSKVASAKGKLSTGAWVRLMGTRAALTRSRA